MSDTARLHLTDEASNVVDVCDVTRESVQSSWTANIACPICGIKPIRVRSYADDPRAPDLPGRVTAIAWCVGRHASVGFLSEPAIPAALRFMGVAEREFFQCKIF